MDQDTSKTPGKGSWRDRLGIGNKGDMPKISDEVKPQQRETQNGAATETTQRGPQIVTKTAPMAPRAPAAAQARSADRPGQAKKQPQTQGTPRQGENQDLAV